jgi:AbrB family looped-hinge helix DNA binding protein
MRNKKSSFTVTDRGQVTIPGSIRKKLGIGPGTRLRFDTEGNKLVAVKDTSEDPVSAVFGAAGRVKTDAVIARLRGGAKQ